MTTFRCWAEIRGRLYLGPVQAKTEEEAVEIADYKPDWPDIKNGDFDYEIVEIVAEPE